MEGYLRAASTISRLAVGDRTLGADVGDLQGAAHRVADAPRRRRADRHARRHLGRAHLPGRRRIRLQDAAAQRPDRRSVRRRVAQGEQIELSINGERAALVPINPEMNESDQPNGLTLHTPPIHVQAGPQRVSAAFIRLADGPVDDLIAPIEHTLADTNVGETYGITALPHLRDFAITGPHRVTGVSDTPSRRRDLHLPADDGARGGDVRGARSSSAWPSRRLSRPRDRRGSRRS